jgi:hypothetical protein
MRDNLTIVICLMLATCGCGPRPVTGGTPGLLTANGDAISEVQVTIHQQNGAAWQPIGFADTTTDGSFALVENQARGPLRLSAGEYRVTLESAGAPIHIPPEYAKAETTPLKVAWSASDSNLNLNLQTKLENTR